MDSNLPYTWIIFLSMVIRYVCCDICLTLWVPLSQSISSSLWCFQWVTYLHKQGVVKIHILVAYTIPVFHADGLFKHFVANGTRHYQCWYIFSRHFILRNAVECLEMKFLQILNFAGYTTCENIYQYFQCCYGIIAMKKVWPGHGARIVLKETS